MIVAETSKHLIAARDWTKFPSGSKNNVPRPRLLLLQATRTFTCPTFFFMHVGNCFESQDGKTLYVDLAVYDDPDILLDLTLDNLKSPMVQGEGMSRSYYKRLAIPLTEDADSTIQVSPLLCSPC